MPGEEDPIDNEQLELPLEDNKPVPVPEPQVAAPIQNPGHYSDQYKNYKPPQGIPDWVAAQTETCQYQGCTNKIDPNKAFTDPDYPDLKLCSAHEKECDICGEHHIIVNMVRTPDNNPVSHICKDCYEENYTTCPNCKQVVKKDEILLPTSNNRYSMKKGGCTECSLKCDSCNRVVDKDSTYPVDNEYFCEDCYSEKYTTCEECSDTISRDDAIYVENFGDYCESCYKDKFVQCEECDETVEKSYTVEVGNNYYCEECAKKLGSIEYPQYAGNFTGFTYTKKDRYLAMLLKLLPISVKELKSKHQSIAAGLNDLIAHSKGKHITKELVAEYRQLLSPEEFPVGYTVWDSGLQRSISDDDNFKGAPPEAYPATYQAADIANKKPQLVINVLASEVMLNYLKVNLIYDLFDKINILSKKSTHPYIHDQIGWIRLELDPGGEYILVDEIQSDHSNAGYKLKHDHNDYEIRKLRAGLKEKYKLDEEGLNKMLTEYSAILKDFPNIAIQAVSKFAKKNGFKKIFWHTYESGKKLKDNEPPKSLYDKTPKENFFLPTENQPFGLNGNFFEREAKRYYNIYKDARQLYLKQL
jgi:hypothetical protein